MFAFYTNSVAYLNKMLPPLVSQVKRTAVQKTLGKKRTVSAVVVTGNKNGAVGMFYFKNTSHLHDFEKYVSFPKQVLLA